MWSVNTVACSCMFLCFLWWRSSRRALWTVLPYKDNVDSVLFVDVSMMLYIMYFPVYRSKEDYNNFTSAHSWLLLTLGVWSFQWINSEVLLFSVSLSADGDSLANKTKLTCNRRVRATESRIWLFQRRPLEDSFHPQLLRTQIRICVNLY